MFDPTRRGDVLVPVAGTGSTKLRPHLLGPSPEPFDGALAAGVVCGSAVQSGFQPVAEEFQYF